MEAQEWVWTGDYCYNCYRKEERVKVIIDEENMKTKCPRCGKEEDYTSDFWALRKHLSNWFYHQRPDIFHLQGQRAEDIAHLYLRKFDNHDWFMSAIHDYAFAMVRNEPETMEKVREAVLLVCKRYGLRKEGWLEILDKCKSERLWQYVSQASWHLLTDKLSESDLNWKLFGGFWFEGAIYDLYCYHRAMNNAAGCWAIMAFVSYCEYKGYTIAGEVKFDPYAFAFYEILKGKETKLPDPVASAIGWQLDYAEHCLEKSNPLGTAYACLEALGIRLGAPLYPPGEAFKKAYESRGNPDVGEVYQLFSEDLFSNMPNKEASMEIGQRILQKTKEVLGF